MHLAHWIELHAVIGLVFAGACAAPLRSRPPVHPVRLRYQVAAVVPRCPSSAALAQAVRDLLGYDPFDPRASRVLWATIRFTHGALEATVSLHDGSGDRGQRVLRAQPHDCPELTRAMALAISLTVDHLAASRATSVHRPVRAAPRLRLSLAGQVAFGATPAVSGGGEVWTALRWSHFSAGLAGRFDGPGARAVIAGGQVSAVSVTGSLLGCGHLHWVFGCGLVEAGALRGRGQALVDSRSAWLPDLGFGARVGVEVPLFRRFFIMARGDLVVPVLGAKLVDQDRTAVLWRTPGAVGSIGAGIGMYFF